MEMNLGKVHWMTEAGILVDQPGPDLTDSATR